MATGREKILSLHYADASTSGP